jgi:hypothetical protein
MCICLSIFSLVNLHCCCQFSCIHTHTWQFRVSFILYTCCVFFFLQPTITLIIHISVSLTSRSSSWSYNVSPSVGLKNFISAVSILESRCFIKAQPPTPMQKLWYCHSLIQFRKCFLVPFFKCATNFFTYWYTGNVVDYYMLYYYYYYYYYYLWNSISEAVKLLYFFITLI